MANYYRREEFPPLLREAIGLVAERLAREHDLVVDAETLRRRVSEEDHEQKGLEVRPLEGRLSRIFGIDVGMANTLCGTFMEPIFRRGRLFDDALATLDELRDRGLRTGLISNTPWGSPARLWRDELSRLGLASRLHRATFCVEVGWRKPDRRIFEAALGEMGLTAGDCLYVGDNPKWDRTGPEGVGMASVLVERGDFVPDGGATVRDLRSLLRRL